MNPMKDEGENTPEWRYQVEEIADLWRPPNEPWARIGAGIIGAVTLLLIALPYVLGKPVHIRKHWTPQGPMVVSGSPAIAFGVSLCAVALFVHFLCFWPYRNSTVCAVGKIFSFAVWVLSFGYYIWKLMT